MPAASPATITVDIDPMIRLGPLTLAWHGLTIALGISLGTWIAVRYARRRQLEPDPLFSAVLWLTLAGMVGARFLFLLENDSAALLRPGEWLGSRGFSFYGGMIFGTLAAGVQLRRRRLDIRYLDAMAYGFPLGMALGRVGDLINGEHYGAASDLPWAIRHPNPAADVPNADVAYHSGGLYEIMLALVIGAVVWVLRGRLQSPGMMLWSVVGFYGAGRFAMFFYRVDSEPLALGLDTSQWISLLLVAIAGGGLLRNSAAARARLRRAAPPAAVIIAAGLSIAGCGGDDQQPRAAADEPVVEDPGPVHVHALGINPSDRSLLIATHTGLFRAAKNERKAKRVAGRYQDTMAFTVVGPDRFLGSGHPDGREGLPPYLGLIESRNAGKDWQEVSLQGRVDFHVLEVAGRRVYGFGSDFKSRTSRFLASRDGGRSWRRLPVPEPLVSLAVDPSNAGHLVASGQKGLHVSRDGGASWRTLGGDPGLLVWPTGERLHLADQEGVVQVSSTGGESWQAVGQIGGRPAAFDPGPRGGLLAALHDGTIKASRDGGVMWRVRSRP